MKKYLSIRNMVWHMVMKSNRLMVGIQYKGKVLFKHDVLVLVTATETQE